MAIRTYTGSCHCGAVRFEAALDIAQGTVKCNCSSCTKARSWLAFAPPDRYRLLAGAEMQGVYQWTPPGREAPRVSFHFCRHCGVRTPARGEIPEMGGTIYAVQVQLLDDLDAEELAGAPIQYLDGRHDHFDRPPAEIRLL